jgi:type II secretory pathway component GspD/PulD (secretin)
VKSDVVKILQDMLVSKAKGKVSVDSRSNALIVTDASSNMARIAKIIKALDIKVPQVHIQARLVQIVRDRVDSLGVNWSGENSRPANPAFSAQGLGSSLATAERRFTLNTGFLGPGFNLDATLDALQSRGDAQLLLNPSITTLHDRASTVSTKDKVNYKQVTQTYSPYVGIQTIETIQQLDVPIELVVRPHVNPDKTVVLEVAITMTSVTSQKEGMPPDTAQQVAATRLVVHNRETGVIGGMLRDSVTKRVNRVPLLGSLPWFLGGGLFRSERVDTQKLELVLFLTPTLAEDI